MKTFLILAILMILSFSTTSRTVNAMGFFPTQPVPVAQDTPQQQQNAINAAYAVSQAAGDAMRKNIASDPSWVTKTNQQIQPQPVFVFPF